MKTIFLDSDFWCYLYDDGTRQTVETDAFDGKCAAYIEGYRYIPAGQSWTRPDGVTFQGEMISPATDWQTLDDAQRAYEREQHQTLTTENADLLEAMAAMVDEVYNADIGEMEG